MEFIKCLWKKKKNLKSNEKGLISPEAKVWQNQMRNQAQNLWLSGVFCVYLGEVVVWRFVTHLLIS